MPEQNINPAAAKFISSLVKSLQILCNGQVDFNESIELVGHINVKVDKVLKFDYIVDEQVSKEGNDSSTTFLSNSYHSSPPSRHNTNAQNSSETRQDTLGFNIPESHNVRGRSLHSDSDIRRRDSKGASDSQVDTRSSRQDISYGFPYSVEASSSGGEKQQDDVVIKLEGGGDSDDCMVLPASPDDYEPIEESSAAHEDVVSVAGPSAFPSDSTDSQFASHGKHTRQGIRKRRMMDQDPDEGSMDTKGETGGGKTAGGKRGASELIGKFAAYECSYCSVILTEYEDLSLHSKSCPSPSCSMICMTCGEKCPNKPEMRQHLKLVHSHKTFGCKFCEMMFLSSSGLLSHTKAKHKPDPKTLCQICGQAFHNRANLEGHMNMHMGIRPFKCKRCGKSYGHSKSLLTHEKICKSIVTLPKRSNKEGSSSSGSTMPTGATKPRRHMSKSAGGKAAAAIYNKQENKQQQQQQQQHQQVSVSEPSQTYMYNNEAAFSNFDTRTDKKETPNTLCSVSERSMDLIAAAAATTNQPFPFSNSYNAAFPESGSQQHSSIDMPSITASGSESMVSSVYPHPNSGYVLPQVAYGLYTQTGILPDQR